MTVDIVRRDGIDNREVVAQWEEGEGFVEAVEELRFTEDEVYERYTKEMIFEEFDGPDFFAIEGSSGGPDE